MFGASMTDHILEVDWTAEKGWSTPTITPCHALAVDPAASVFQYALEGFEGMKAYRRQDGAVALFRPDLNMARMSSSMSRLGGPALDKEGLLDAVKAFVRLERDWVPAGEGYSLYLRPTFISTWPYLGVSPAKSFKVYVIACPVGPYYPEGFKPVKLLADHVNVRAWPGGTGAFKVGGWRARRPHCSSAGEARAALTPPQTHRLTARQLGGNYAPTIKVGQDAIQKGFTQVLWLFGPDREVRPSRGAASDLAHPHDVDFDPLPLARS